MTKKLISLLLSVVMVATLFVATVSAAGGEANVSMEISATEVNVGDTFTVAVSYEDMKVASFACKLQYDGELVEYVSALPCDPEIPDEFVLCTKRGVSVGTISTPAEAKVNSQIGFVVVGMTESSYVACDIYVATFVAKQAGTVEFTLVEDSSGTDGYKDVVETKSVTITAPHVCAPADTTKYESDGTGHWQLCSCGAKLNEGTCAGGSATCTAKAVCSVCGNTYGELAAHDFTAEVKKAETLVNADAINCNTAAEYYYSCSACGAVEGKADHTFKGEVDTTKHNFGELIPEVGATHTKDELAAGMKAHYVCSVCSKYFDENKVETTKDALVIAAPVHTFEGNWISVGKDGHAKACSCGLLDTPVAHTPDIPAPTEDQKQLCSDCGEVLAQELGHQCALHLTTVEAVKADCVNDGNIAYYVCDCGKLYADAEAKTAIAIEDTVIPAEGHDAGEWLFNAGEHVKVCTKCDAELTDVAKCSSTGDNVATCVKKAVCDVCGNEYGELSTEHVPGEYVSADEGDTAHIRLCALCETPVSSVEEHVSTGDNVATCVKKAVCDLCGCSYGEPINHNYDEYDVITKEGHAKACTYGCGTTTEVEAHVDDETGEFCSVCGFVYHTCGGKEMTLVKEDPATCTENGMKAYYICSCGKNYADADAKTEITDLESLIIPAAHTVVVDEGYEATCLADGLTDASYCSACKEVYAVATVIPATGHDWTAWVTVKVEGDTKYQERYCACGAKQENMLTPEHKHSLVHVEAKAPTCSTEGNIEYWYCSTCDWMETIGGVATNRLAVILPITHDLQHVEAKAATCLELGNIEYWACKNCDRIEVAGGVLSNIKAVMLPTLDHTIEHVAAKAAACEAEGNVEYWYCTVCGYAWLDEARTLVTNLQSVKLGATHDLVHYEAKAATCLELGNIEYWACKNCDRIEVAGGVLSNIKAVMLPTLAHDIEHVAAKAPGCEIEGNVEYYYCTICGYAWLDEARTQVTNLQSVKLPEAHNVEHVAAKAPTATENGNIEYWYCKDCGYAWLDELCIKNTNLKAVILPATGEPTEPSNPGTGDNAIFFAVALVAVATVGASVITFKKKREN